MQFSRRDSIWEIDGPPRWPRHWRNPTARAKAAEVIRLDTKGFQRTEIARRTGIGIASVYPVGCQEGNRCPEGSDVIRTWSHGLDHGRRSR